MVPDFFAKTPNTWLGFSVFWYRTQDNWWQSATESALITSSADACLSFALNLVETILCSDFIFIKAQK